MDFAGTADSAGIQWASDPPHGGGRRARSADELCRQRVDVTCGNRPPGRAWRERGSQSPGQSENEMRLPPIRMLQDAGLRVGLGCDNCSCSDAQNMFVAMKLFALLAAISDPIPGPMQSKATIRAATEAGAEGSGKILAHREPRGAHTDLHIF